MFSMSYRGERRQTQGICIRDYKILKYVTVTTFGFASILRLGLI